MHHTDDSLTTRDLSSFGGHLTDDDRVQQEPADRGDEPADRAPDEAAPEPRAAAAGDKTADDASARLFPAEEQDAFQQRWERIQTGFVDDPRNTVQEADALVASVMQRLADGFAQERAGLEGQWDRGEDVSTEDLRVALQRYRSFFRRLLSA